MMFRVLHDFSDMHDGGRLYHAGDIYPRSGMVVDEKRLSELSGRGNRLGKPLIAEQAEEKKPTRKRVKKDD